MPGSVSSAELFKRHAPFAARLLRRLGVARDDVEDVVQEVFLVVHRRGFVEGAAKPTTWIGSICVRVAANYRRRHRKGDVDAGAMEAVASRSDPEQELAEHEALRRAQWAVEQLDIRRREVFVLRELEGLACDAVAEALEIPVGTVYYRLHEARKQFVALVRGAAEQPETEQRSVAR